MPGGDKTGPWGSWVNCMPREGFGRGFGQGRGFSPGRGRGLGRGIAAGRGRGLGRGRGFAGFNYSVYDDSDELQRLKAENEAMREEIEGLKRSD